MSYKKVDMVTPNKPYLLKLLSPVKYKIRCVFEKRKYGTSIMPQKFMVSRITLHRRGMRDGWEIPLTAPKGLLAFGKSFLDCGEIFDGAEDDHKY